MKIYLIRHGRTAGNLEKRYVGSTDESILPEEQERLRKFDYPEVDVVYVSPRLRCLETAAVLFPGKELRKVKLLAECDFGAFEYKNYKELSDNEDYQRWIDSGGTIGVPGGEDRETFQNRCQRGYWQVLLDAERRGCRQIAIVAHGGTIMAVMERVAEPCGDYFSWMSENGCGYLLDSESGSWEKIEKR